MSAVAAVTSAKLTPTEEATIVREAFAAGITRPLSWRRAQLAALDRMLSENGERIERALGSDLGKPALEAALTEIVAIRGEVKHTLRNLRRWARPRRVGVPGMFLPASARIVREPLGTVLIVSPWNYPLHLLFMPLIGALAAGNAAVLKPSELAPETSALVAELVPRYLDRVAVRVVEGAIEETTELLGLPWDHIFYTGNGTVGRIVLEAAAKHLTPVTLELGGKSPVWIDETANLEESAGWLTWAKYTNAGQTCVAPDYVLTTPEMVPRLIDALRREITARYGADPRQSADFGRIVNTRHLDRLVGLLPAGRAAVGGVSDREERYLGPTVLSGVSLDDPVMQQEIFGPILPIIAVADVSEAIRVVNERDKPLAAYVFTRSRATQRAFIENTSSGSMAINAAVVQLGVPQLPFGGVGPSGMGSYHGEHSVRTFSHERAVLTKFRGPNLAKLARPPYTAAKERMLRKAM